MKTKKGYTLRPLGQEYILVAEALMWLMRPV